MKRHMPILADCGLETDLIFHHSVDLPEFAAFPLLENPHGRRLLSEFSHRSIDAAVASDLPIVLDTPTWRASSNWGAALGHDADALHRLNTAAVRLLFDVRAKRSPGADIMISGVIGPRDDGYGPGTAMTAVEAADYHRPQMTSLANAGADVLTALTITSTAEATGIAMVAAELDVPVRVSFTVETDGLLPSGEQLGDAITRVDRVTAGAIDRFLINCAHPSHIELALDRSAPWIERIGGIRANASRLSHAELDESETLDEGDAVELAVELAQLVEGLPTAVEIGGCCGTDARHLAELGRAVAGAFAVER